MMKMRSGVVMFITLATIASLSVLLIIMFLYVEKLQKENLNLGAYTQSFVYYTKTSKIIESLLSNSKTKDQGRGILYNQGVAIKAGDNTLLLKCTPIASRIPIQWLDKNKETNNTEQYIAAIKFFDIFTEKYNIQNRLILLEIIQNRLGQIQSSNYQDGRFDVEKKQRVDIKSLFSNYCSQTNDWKACEVDWGNIYSMYDSPYIESKYLSDELVSILFKIPIENVKQKRTNGENLVQFILNNNGDKSLYNENVFSSTDRDEIACIVTFDYMSQKYQYSFNYKNKKAINFEFNEKI